MITNFFKFIKTHKKIKKTLFIGLSLLIINYLFLVILKLIPFKELKTFQNRPISTRIYDTNNVLLRVTSLEDGSYREWTNYKEIPPQLIKYVLKAEDKRFFVHHGVDYFAIINAFFQNKDSKKIVRGASTITMQVSKMIFNNQKRTYLSKIKDVFRAWQIEAKLSKKEILELYINNIPFGNRCEGFTSSARTFFSKELSTLTEEEICSLCIIPRHPTLYNPLTNKKNNLKMAKSLLQKGSHKNSTEDFIIEFPKNTNNYPYLMPHYVNYVQKEFLSKNTNCVTDLYLTCNMEVQQFCINLLQYVLSTTQSSRIYNSGILVLNNKDSSVIAWLGNANYFDFTTNGQIDSVLIKNQPGSSMKPFLYALALEQKNEFDLPLYYPSKVLKDIPLEFGQNKIYIPQNFNNYFNGPIRFRISLASSLNIPAVDILNTIGVNNYLNTLYKMEFNSLRTQAEKVDLGLALGAGEVSLKELCTAFTVFTCDGIYKEIKHLKNYKTKNNKKIKLEQTQEKRQIYSKDTSRIICSILSDKPARSLGFGYNQVFASEFPSIFKTGTSNQYQNITALGSTKDFTVGVWMGNHNGQTVIGKTGSSLPGGIALQILDLLEKHNPKSLQEKSFLEPENYKKERICSLSGLKVGPNCVSSVVEYVPNNLELEECTWHQNIQGQIQTVYPSEYQQWLRLYNMQEQIDFSSTNLQFMSPQNNSIFYYSNINTNQQAINVEVIGGYDDLASITYDGQFLQDINRPFSFKLPVELGNHTCTVTCQNEVIQLNFTVE